MKKIIIFISILCVLSSCSKKSDLDGIWMGAYQLHYTDQGEAYTQLKLLFEFDGDSLHSKFFGNDDRSGAYEKTAAFRRVNGYILPKGSVTLLDSLKIVSIHQDSLVFRLFNKYDRDLVFKKVRSTSQVKPELLQGKTFAFQSGRLTDTLEFVSDSLCIKMGEINDGMPIKKWKVDSYKHLNFIVINQSKSLPMLIDTIQNKSIHLSYFYKKTGTIRLKPLPKKWDLAQLKGTWVCWDAIPNGVDLPQWVEEDANRGEYLNFSDNKLLKRTLLGRQEKFYWKASSNEQGIYFPSKMSNGGINAYWKIVHLSAEKLRIERNNIQASATRGKEYLEFQRIKY